MVSGAGWEVKLQNVASGSTRICKSAEELRSLGLAEREEEEEEKEENAIRTHRRRHSVRLPRWA